MLGLLSQHIKKENERIEKENQKERIVKWSEKGNKTVDDEVAKKDINGDGHISQEEMEMDLEFKEKN